MSSNVRNNQLSATMSPDQTNVIELKPATDSHLNRLNRIVQCPYTGLCSTEYEAFVLHHIGGLGRFAKLFEIAR